MFTFSFESLVFTCISPCILSPVLPPLSLSPKFSLKSRPHLLVIIQKAKTKSYRFHPMMNLYFEGQILSSFCLLIMQYSIPLFVCLFNYLFIMCVHVCICVFIFSPEFMYTFFISQRVSPHYATLLPPEPEFTGYNFCYYQEFHLDEESLF